MATTPASARSSPPTRRSSVDLPQPDGPSSATISPARMLEVDVAEHDALAAVRRREPARDALDPHRQSGRGGSVDEGHTLETRERRASAAKRDVTN